MALCSGPDWHHCKKSLAIWSPVSGSQLRVGWSVWSSLRLRPAQTHKKVQYIRRGRLWNLWRQNCNVIDLCKSNQSESFSSKLLMRNFVIWKMKFILRSLSSCTKRSWEGAQSSLTFTWPSQQSRFSTFSFINFQFSLCNKQATQHPVNASAVFFRMYLFLVFYRILLCFGTTRMSTEKETKELFTLDVLFFTGRNGVKQSTMLKTHQAEFLGMKHMKRKLEQTPKNQLDVFSHQIIVFAAF